MIKNIEGDLVGRAGDFMFGREHPARFNRSDLEIGKQISIFSLPGGKAGTIRIQSNFKLVFREYSAPQSSRSTFLKNNF